MPFVYSPALLLLSFLRDISEKVIARVHLPVEVKAAILRGGTVVLEHRIVVSRHRGAISCVARPIEAGGVCDGKPCETHVHIWIYRTRVCGPRRHDTSKRPVAHVRVHRTRVGGPHRRGAVEQLGLWHRWRRGRKAPEPVTSPSHGRRGLEVGVPPVRPGRGAHEGGSVSHGPLRINWGDSAGSSGHVDGLIVADRRMGPEWPPWDPSVFLPEPVRGACIWYCFWDRCTVS